MAHSSPTLINRFLRLFIQEYWKPIWERVIDGALFIAAFVYANSKGKLSVEALKTNLLDALLPFILALCIIALVHLVRTGILLSKRISEENAASQPTKYVSPILLSDGHPIEEWLPAQVEEHFQIRILGIVVFLSVFPVLISYFTWMMRITFPSEPAHSSEYVPKGFMQFSKAWFVNSKFSAKDRVTINMELTNQGEQPVDGVYVVFITDLVQVGRDADRVTHEQLLRDALQNHARMINEGQKGVPVGKGHSLWATMKLPDTPKPPLTQQQVNDILKGRLRIYVYAWSRWRDAPHDLDFCEWLQPPAINEIDNDKLVWHVCSDAEDPNPTVPRAQ